MAAKVLGMAALVLGALPAHADILWLQREGDQLQARIGELSVPGALPALRDAQPVLPGGRVAPMATAADHYSFAPGEGDARFTALRVGGNGVLTYFQARHGRQETKAANDLELVPAEPGGNTFRLFFKGRPAHASRVNVDTAAGWRKSLTPNADGSVTLDTPIPGLYVLEVSAKLNDANVTIDGKKYEDVRYTATLSFEVKP
ncbi:MAG: hypothetical protein ABT02_07205 [Comamonadaceae bacterium SCN 68-20]|jgi:hypothetical protein|nr:MAG: hypothetical protein ABT02_07205 [Comamonadaceae bacterium SCN 68-20]OJX05664.1 MAG: hypothetical protein BGO75_15945 [Burkholderiales bacterium 68-20]UJB66685.1 hypothetical protein YS110_18890 [Acidovorax sp. YS12]